LTIIREAIFLELAAAVQLGAIEEIAEQPGAFRFSHALLGHSHKAGFDAERARLNVTRAVRKVVRKIEAGCPVLGRHLDRAVQTGLFCAYQPDPTFPIEWER